MKLTFVSNYINHHQIPLSDALYRHLGDDYRFVQTMPMEEERRQMGWQVQMDELPYLRLLYEQEQECLSLIDDSDLVIFGWSEREDLVQKRMIAGKPVIRVSERLYREGQWKMISPRGLAAKYKEHVRYRKDPVCMLCAGAYTASDFALIRSYPGKMFRWGYFPPLRTYKEGELWAKKDLTKGVQIVWAGRLIPLKHPEYMIRLAKKLKASYGSGGFHIHLIGGGELEQQIREQASGLGLDDVISFYGFLPQEQVRDIMETSHIHLFTSNYLEGWGAVVNEGMNSGCLEIVNAQVGAAPYLIRHRHNGLVYPDDSYEKMEELVVDAVAHWDRYCHMGMNAYETIQNLWNADHAAEELIRFGEDLLQGRIIPAKEGPLSPAPVIFPKKMYRAMKEGLLNR